VEGSEEMRWRSLVLQSMKKAIALPSPSAALLLALPQKDGTKPSLFGRIAFIPERMRALLFPAWPNPFQSQLNSIRFIELFYFGQSLGQVPPCSTSRSSPFLLFLLFPSH